MIDWDNPELIMESGTDFHHGISIRDDNRAE